MVWFIIIIVAIILIKFIVDSNKQADSVAKQGGMRRKYSTLVDCFLSGRPDCKIVQETNTFIRVGSSSAGGSTYFDIMQTYGTVTIQWESKSILIGDHKLEWEFDEFMGQEKMLEKINSDITAYMENVLGKYK